MKVENSLRVQIEKVAFCRIDVFVFAIAVSYVSDLEYFQVYCM